MTERQRHAVAAGFRHILHEHHEVYEQWMTIPKDDVVAMGALIREEIALAQTPSKDDLSAMARYIDANLKTQGAQIQAAYITPRHAGIFFGMTMDS
jgi:hypothetical protein